MSVIGSNILAGASGQGGGYNLTNSLRFRSSANAYLNRTPASAGNRKTWTWSAWIKLGALSGNTPFFDAGNGSTELYCIRIQTNQLSIEGYSSGYVYARITTAVYRDPSAWYHVVGVLDTTQATASDRVKLYVNGVQVTAFSYSVDPSFDTSYRVNNNVAHYLGHAPFGSQYYDGYMGEINFIDGQALTPSSFGETSSTTGVWIPKKYTGTYGTNGFYLPFTDNSALTTSSNAGLGKDFSGNSNYWTTNNISITAGSTYDSMTDVPTLTSATAANYCTLNPLAFFATGASALDGNLTLSITTAGGNIKPTFGATTGKFYAEFTINNIGGATGTQFSVATGSPSTSATPLMNAIYYVNGQTYDYASASFVSYGASYTTGDIIGVAWDCDAFSVTFYKNNVSQGTLSNAAINANSAGQGVAPIAGSGGTSSSVSVACNYGQRPFAYTPPTGFNRLNTFNLPTPTIGATASTLASKNFNAVIRNGYGSSGGTLDCGFQPDFVWEKTRSAASSHTLWDSVRGLPNALRSNETTAELSQNWLTGFVSNGLTFGTNDYGTGTTLVEWVWKANQGTNVTNTAGSITSTVSANTSAGFSVVTYTGTGSAATIGHGLGVTPAMFIVKSRSTTGNWNVYHANQSATPQNGILYLNLTDAFFTLATWNNTAPTSSVFSINGSGYGVNNSSVTYVAYCFAPVAGYSAFGSYTGNGSTDGPFIYTGFRPRWLFVKKSAGGTSYWQCLDTSRSPYNLAGEDLIFDLPDAEKTIANGFNHADILSNGFKLRNTNCNDSGSTYIFGAFAENPFKYANAR